MKKLIKTTSHEQNSLHVMENTGKSRHIVKYNIFHDGVFVSAGEIGSNTLYWCMTNLQSNFTDYKIEGDAYDAYKNEFARDKEIYNILHSSSLTEDEQLAFRGIFKDYNYSFIDFAKEGYNFKRGHNKFIEDNCTDEARAKRLNIKLEKENKKKKERKFFLYKVWAFFTLVFAFFIYLLS